MSYEKGVNHMDNMSDAIEHHGVKGQKWGVRRYKEARSSGIKASKMNQEAASRREEARTRYIQNNNKMYANVYKRDAASSRLKSAKPNSMKATRYTRKMNAYNSKVKAYSDKRNAAEKDFDNADKDVSKYYDSYKSALKEAANQKVEIKKKHTLGTAFVMGIFGVPYTYSPSSKDIFDDNVMTYRSVNHVKHSDAQMSDEIEHHGVKGMKWGQRKATRSAGGSIGNRIQTHYANKARAQQWRTQYNDRGEMSTEALRRAVNRLNLENQFDAATKQAMASSSQSVFSKYKNQYINGAIQGAVNNTNQVGNKVGQAAATAMVKRIGTAAAASV